MAKILVSNLSARSFIDGSTVVKPSKLPQSVEEVAARKFAKLYPSEIKIIDVEKGGAKEVKASKAKSAAVEAEAEEEAKSFEEGAK
jgi:hypothetical protein